MQLLLPSCQGVAERVTFNEDLQKERGSRTRWRKWKGFVPSEMSSIQLSWVAMVLRWTAVRFLTVHLVRVF